MLSLQVRVDVWKHLELRGDAGHILEGGRTTMGSAGGLFMVAVREIGITSGAKQNAKKFVLKTSDEKKRAKYVINFWRGFVGFILRIMSPIFNRWLKTP